MHFIALLLIERDENGLRNQQLYTINLTFNRLSQQYKIIQQQQRYLFLSLRTEN